jgi:hypothetical protein
VHEVVVVSARQLRAPFGELLWRTARRQLAELGEEVLEAGRGDDLDQQRRLGTVTRATAPRSR